LFIFKGLRSILVSLRNRQAGAFGIRPVRVASHWLLHAQIPPARARQNRQPGFIVISEKLSDRPPPGKELSTFS
jgi:hypothetical protein